MRGKVGQPQRFGQVAQVGEELRSPRQVDEPLMLLGGQSGGDEVLELPFVVEDGDAAHPRAGQGAGSIHDLSQDGIEVEVFVDAQTGLAQPGEALPQRLYLSHKLVGSLQLITSIGLRKARYSSPHAPAGIETTGAIVPFSAILYKYLRKMRLNFTPTLIRVLYTGKSVCPIEGDT